MDTKATVINTADICELAHYYTCEECNRLGLETDTIDENLEIIYPPKAQKIFEKHQNKIEELLGHN